MTTTPDAATAARNSLLPRKAPTGFEQPPLTSGKRIFTPADIAAWEDSLGERSELCLTVSGTGTGKLTLYAGPDNRGSRPAAILTGLNRSTYVSRPWTSNTEEWMTSLLSAVKTLTDSDT